LPWHTRTPKKRFHLTIGRKIRDDELFHMAPSVTYKFRNLSVDEEKNKEVTEGVLSSYIATTSSGEGGVFLEKSSILSFAFCYLISHAMLDLIEEEDMSEIMDYLVDHEKELNRLVE